MAKSKPRVKVPKSAKAGEVITIKTLMARLELPTTGEYTLNVAQIELLPPSTPSTTSFTVETTKIQ